MNAELVGETRFFVDDSLRDLYNGKCAFVPPMPVFCNFLSGMGLECLQQGENGLIYLEIIDETQKFFDVGDVGGVVGMFSSVCS